MKFISLAIGISTAIIGLIVLVELFAGMYPTLITGLTSLNNSAGNATSGEHLIELRTLIAPDGVLPLIVVAVFVIGVIIGLFALVAKKKKEER